MSELGILEKLIRLLRGTASQWHYLPKKRLVACLCYDIDIIGRNKRNVTVTGAFSDTEWEPTKMELAVNEGK